MRKLRLVITWAVTTAMLAGSAGVITALSADAAVATLFSTTGNVNVRAAANTTSAVLRVLKTGETVRASGTAANDWQPISFDGKTAYVSAKYLKATSTTAPIIVGPAGTKTTTVNVNVRAAASLKSDIVSVLMEGTSVSVTGRAQGDFSEVTVDGTLRWMYSLYLSGATTGTPPPTTPPPTPPATTPPVVGTFVTTAVLTMRASASPTAASLGDLKANTSVGLTGVHQASYSQIVYNGKAGWVLTGYLKATAQSNGVTLPAAKGLLYLTANDVAVRTDANGDAPKVTTLSKGTVLQSTGIIKNSYTQVIYAAKLNWVASQYLSTDPQDSGSLGSSSLDKLNPTAKAFVPVIRANFPEIKTMYGWRASSAYSSDHPNGRALDIMIPSYKTNKALGDRIAKFAIDNAGKYKIKYVIWRQRNYTISRGTWVAMADRGSDTQNHYDHVHVSFLS